MLPDLSGFDVCREIRRAGYRMPVIILSAKHDEIDVVLGLEIGADDYIAKPFRPRELLARIGAQLRRAKEMRGDDKPADGRLVFRDMVIDTAERRVTRSDRDIVLTHTEFDLLSYLASNAGKVLSRERILSAVWGYEHPIETRVIDVHVRNLRRKIEPDPAQPRHILAVPGHRIPLRRAPPLRFLADVRGGKVHSAWCELHPCSILASQARRPGGPIPFRPSPSARSRSSPWRCSSAAVLATYTYSTPNVELPLVIAVALFFVVVVGANILRLAVRHLRPGR